MMRHKEDFSDVGITNDFMFGYIMQDEERCRKFLEQILGIKIKKVVNLQKQKDINLSIDARGIRLDIYVDGGDTIFNCEMQTGNNKNLPRRSRYYQGNIDLDLLAKGVDFSLLKDSYIIFICTFDPFGKGKYMYRFSNHCDDDHEITLDDGLKKVFVNTKGKFGEQDNEFLELMQYLDTSEVPKNCSNELVYELDNALVAARKNPKWRDSYMTWEIYGEDKRQEGRQEGRQETLQQVKMVLKMINQGKTKEEAAKESGLTIEEVEEILSDN